jgi:hypothetical protein
VSLLDNNIRTSAWTTVLVDRGASAGLRRYGGYLPAKFLNNFDALSYSFVKGAPFSRVYQWDDRRKRWIDVIQNTIDSVPVLPAPKRTRVCDRVHCYDAA